MIPYTEYPVGLTGGMGSGKSTVSRMLAMHGFAVIDADFVTRNVYRIPTVHKQLVREFGDDIYEQTAQDVRLNRRLLGQRAFSSDLKRRRLNEIMHPVMKDLINDEICSAPGRTVIDAALLFEAGWDTLVKTTVAVLCPTRTRIARIIKRDGLSCEEIRARIDAQKGDYPRCADFLIYNTGNIRLLERQVETLFLYDKNG